MRNLGKVGIIWTGRGLASYYGAGFAWAIRERGIREVYRQGISGGAFNALGADDLTRVIAIWKEVVEKAGPSFLFDFKSLLFSRRVVSNVRRILKGLSPIFSNAPLQKLASYFDFEELLRLAAEGGVETEVAVFNEKTWRQEFVSINDPRVQKNPRILERALVAGASIYEFFPAIPVYDDNDDKYSDGQVFSIKRAIDYGCDTVFVLLNEASGPPKGVAEGLRGVLFKIAANKEIVGRISEQHQIESYRDKTVVFQLPKEADIETSSFVSFQKGDVSEGIERASKEGLRILDNL